MKRSLTTIALVPLLAAAEAAVAAPKVEDYPVLFTVKATDIIPGRSVSMTLFDGDTYFIVEERCILHCYSYKPGTELHGRFTQMHMAINVMGTDSNGKPKVLRFNVTSQHQ